MTKTTITPIMPPTNTSITTTTHTRRDSKWHAKIVCGEKGISAQIGFTMKHQLKSAHDLAKHATSRATVKLMYKLRIRLILVLTVCCT